MQAMERAPDLEILVLEERLGSYQMEWEWGDLTLAIFFPISLARSFQKFRAGIIPRI